MVRAFILIEVAAGYSTAVVDSLAGQSGIVDVVRVTGPVDVIAIVTAPTIRGVSDLVGEKVHTLQGVIRTTTCVALQGS